MECVGTCCNVVKCAGIHYPPHFKAFQHIPPLFARFQNILPNFCTFHQFSFGIPKLASTLLYILPLYENLHRLHNITLYSNIFHHFPLRFKTFQNSPTHFNIYSAYQPNGINYIRNPYISIGYWSNAQN